MPRPFLVLAGLSLSLAAAEASSITPMPALDDPLGPSMQAVGGKPPSAVSIDRLETSSTGEPAVISSPTFVQTSPSIFEMIGGGEDGDRKARRGGQPMMIKAGVVNGAGSSAPAPMPEAQPAGLPTEEAQDEEIEVAPDPSTIEVDDETPAAPPTATPR